MSRSRYLVLSMLVSRLALAWGDLGHQAVGEIAERNLTPEAKKMVQSILGVEPMALAATFPDKVRSDPRFKDFTPYHFIEVPEGQEYTPRIEKDANTIISQAPGLLKDKNVSRDRKMILLRYLIHVVGDVHQPFHVGNGLDMGANLCDVIWNGRKDKLHEVWDTALVNELRSRSKGYFDYQQVSNIVTQDNALTDADRARITSATPLDWYREAAAERQKLYPDATPIADGRDRPYCKYVDPITKKVVNGKYDPSALPKLGADYKERAMGVMERQMLKGGLRLAAMLNDIAKDFEGSTGTFEPEEDLLRALKLKNARPPEEGLTPHAAPRGTGESELHR